MKKRISWCVVVASLLMGACGDEEDGLPKCTAETSLDPTYRTLNQCPEETPICVPAVSFGTDTVPSGEVTGGRCVWADDTGNSGSPCSTDADCLSNESCLYGLCAEVCWEGKHACLTGLCYLADWIAPVGDIRMGYCVPEDWCRPGECPAGRECRLLIEGGVPEVGGSYVSRCTPVLGMAPEGSPCSHSDECAAPMVCAPSPGGNPDDRICRGLCIDSSDCSESAVGPWCSLDTEVNGLSFHFLVLVEDTSFGVCMAGPTG